MLVDFFSVNSTHITIDSIVRQNLTYKSISQSGRQAYSCPKSPRAVGKPTVSASCIVYGNMIVCCTRGGGVYAVSDRLEPATHFTLVMSIRVPTLDGMNIRFGRGVTPDTDT